MLPELIDAGVDDLLLPPGIHQASLEDVRARFVDTSPTYARRVEQWTQYLQFRTLVAGLVTIQHEYVDGSFVTSRPAPKDIDVSFWIDAAQLDALDPAKRAAFFQIFGARFQYGCDAYLITPCPSGHAAYADYQAWKTRTEEAWPAYKDRKKLIVPDVEKGYVEVVVP